MCFFYASKTYVIIAVTKIDHEILSYYYLNQVATCLNPLYPKLIWNLQVFRKTKFDFLRF